jgi:hypothetical protein
VPGYYRITYWNQEKTGFKQVTEMVQFDSLKAVLKYVRGETRAKYYKVDIWDKNWYLIPDGR